ncbi:outer membrane beta-barrel protein [Paraferrimonas sp. SM1919]|uniref:outer membrane beta-barrel protein n=1 Tax=Paraferrimonas sp. SM1919 TaxID=2662263 RepID=UPI0013CFD6E0|nr:outer membrane beta-barrel protein [Paraferrimonas sp. SM1919]
MRYLIMMLVWLNLATHAKADTYAGIALGYTAVELALENPTSTQDANISTTTLQLGHYFNDYFAVESRFNNGLNRSGGIHLSSVISVYAKANLPMTKQFALYALAGISHSKLDYNAQETAASSASFGLGGHYAFDKRHAMTLEYVNLADKTPLRTNQLNLGYQYRF